MAVGINKLIRQAEQQALDELATLEQTLAQTPSSAPRFRQIVSDLENCVSASTAQA